MFDLRTLIVLVPGLPLAAALITAGLIAEAFQLIDRIVSWLETAPIDNVGAFAFAWTVLPVAVPYNLLSDRLQGAIVAPFMNVDLSTTGSVMVGGSRACKGRNDAVLRRCAKGRRE